MVGIGYDRKGLEQWKLLQSCGISPTLADGDHYRKRANFKSQHELSDKVHKDTSFSLRVEGPGVYPGLSRLKL